MRREMHAENFGGGHLFENVHLEDQENDVCITEMIKLWGWEMDETSLAVLKVRFSLL